MASDTEISWTFPNENAEFRVYLPKDTLVITIDSSNGFSADSFIILQEILNLSKEEMIPFEYVQIPVGGEFSNTTLKATNEVENSIELQINWKTSNFQFPKLYLLSITKTSAKSPIFAFSTDGIENLSPEQKEVISQNNKTRDPAENSQDIDVNDLGEDSQDGVDVNNTGENSNNEKIGDSDGDGEGGGSGLANGAIAGIAVGAVILVALAIVGAWLFLRKRKRIAAASHHGETSTSFTTTYPTGPATRSGDFLGEKENSAMVAESPRSQLYTDNGPQAMHMAGATGNGAAAATTTTTTTTTITTTAGIGGAVTTGTYHSLADDNSPDENHQRESSIAQENINRVATDSPGPNTLARHLVEEDMTEDDIRRLEEEERELDRQIEEAGRKK